MTATPTPRAPGPPPNAAARALLELAIGAQQVYQEAEVHFTQAVKSAVKAGATWDHVARWLDTMTADEARERFENADGAVYLNDETVITLAVVAECHGLTTLREALTVVLEAATETLTQETSDDGEDRANAGGVVVLPAAADMTLSEVAALLRRPPSDVAYLADRAGVETHTRHRGEAVVKFFLAADVPRILDADHDDGVERLQRFLSETGDLGDE